MPTRGLAEGGVPRFVGDAVPAPSVRPACGRADGAVPMFLSVRVVPNPLPGLIGGGAITRVGALGLDGRRYEGRVPKNPPKPPLRLPKLDPPNDGRNPPIRPKPLAYTAEHASRSAVVKAIRPLVFMGSKPFSGQDHCLPFYI